jgi:hypothetical protein
MKRFLTSIAFCLLLLAFGFFAFAPGSEADGDIARKLLDLPAPPPPNPNFKVRGFQRPPEFYDQDNPPADDATVDDLLEYWMRQAALDQNRNYSIKPTDKVLGRLMDEIGEDPEKLTSYLGLFIENEDGIEFVKKLYDQELINRKLEKDWRDTVKTWLTYNSQYFSSELLRVAQTVRDENEYVTNQGELLALAKVDWDKAEPILNKLVNDSSQPISQTLARWAFYQRAIDTKNESEAERWRDELKKTVEDKSALPGNRDLAMDALVRGGDFAGRDEWYLQLLEDETLHDLRVGGQTYTGLTTIITLSPAGKYTERMIELLQSPSKPVRSAAIRNLAYNGGIKNEQAVRQMIPWLEDPKWANDVNNSRRAMISALKDFRMPESVPGLLKILAERQAPKETGNVSTNRAANTVRPSTNANSVDLQSLADYQNMYEYRSFLSEVVDALGAQRDPRAVPELRSAITEFEPWQRQTVVRAILNCGGFSSFEQVEAVEQRARSNDERAENMRLAANTAANMAKRVEEDEDVEIDMPVAVANSVPSRIEVDRQPTVVTPEEIRAMLGSILYTYEDPSEDVVSALLNRIESLEKSEPMIAAGMRSILRNWRGVAVNAVLLRVIKSGKAELADVVAALIRRAEIREKQINDIYDMRGGTPFAAGIAACLLEQNGEYDAVIGGDNAEAKTAALGCARMIRAKLPVRNVADLLNSGDKLLALAAERYLESEDSPEARAFVLAKHPNEAKVLGARTSFKGEKELELDNIEALYSTGEYEFSAGYLAGMNFPELEKTEEKLRKEILENPELLGVYAFHDHFVKMYRDRATFSWEEDPARYRERVLERSELERLQGYLTESNVDELPPFLSYCGEYCEDARELLMMGRAGGRRVFIYGFQEAPFFEKLDAIFEEFRRPPAKLRYYLQDRVTGLEILFEDKNSEAVAVWKNGPDLRVLIADTAKREAIDKQLEAQDAADEENEELDYEEMQERARKRRDLRAYESLGWFRFGNGRPIATARQPDRFSFIPERDALSVKPGRSQWKASSPGLEIRTDAEGIYKIVRGQMTRIRQGVYDSPLLVPGGRWAIARRFQNGDDEEEYYGMRLVRINLANGREIPVKFTRYPPLMPIAFVAAQNKVLLGTGYGSSDEESIEDDPGATAFDNFYWLDAETGTLTKVKGDVAALAQQSYRPLQAVAGKPDEYWAAIPNSEENETVIGTYNERTLAFKAVRTLPQIGFTSVEMWVDEIENKAYIAYSGHLLSVSLK